MQRFTIKSTPTQLSKIIVDNDVRVSIISDDIIRVEKSQDGRFVDLPSQTIVNRDFGSPRWESKIDDKTITVTTAKHVFVIDKRTLRVKSDGVVAKSGGRQNLKGTVRTLDCKGGEVRLNDGIFSKSGVTLLDDSKTLLLTEDGHIKPRAKGCKDIYVFAFGKDFYGGLQEFFNLTGYPPVMPKYVFGNWWSRYHAYSAQEYLDLMSEFERRQIPFTVATIDMDWHLVDDVPKDVAYGHRWQGRGWTGYTFNPKLFPDYKAFFKELKAKNLHITMNLHPRDGVRYFEAQYAEMARANGIDPATKKTVEFDLTDEKFLTSYFDVLHHPYEEDGVDFWWIDWQQGTKSKMKGLDPLWLLNHYHTLDNNRNGNRGLILSRYAGIGSHRYPLGFSGDTYVRWSALKFQPYFTATASNVGYTWWSHDIGGHMSNKGDGEIYLRWLQFGAFSPINRLHSTNTTLSKEPWNYPSVCDQAIKVLQLRHRLIPYLYTACVNTATCGAPLVQPLYYKYDTPMAYSKKYRNQYLFGSEMLVCPVTDKGDADGTVEHRVWLPKGVWTDFFMGKKFVGDQEYVISCPIDYIPVFVKEGGIVPMLHDGTTNDVSYKNIDLLICVGNNEYVMRDEDGSLTIEQRLTAEGCSITLTPSGNIDVQRVNVQFLGIKSADISCDDVSSNSNVITVDHLPKTIQLKNIVTK
ncbi:MAG: TIM-barrel domain-containing protein [Christensenellales bacterium]